MKMTVRKTIALLLVFFAVFFGSLSVYVYAWTKLNPTRNTNPLYGTYGQSNRAPDGQSRVKYHNMELASLIFLGISGLGIVGDSVFMAGGKKEKETPVS